MGAGHVTQVSIPELGLSSASVLRAEGALGGFVQWLQGQACSSAHQVAREET